MHALHRYIAAINAAVSDATISQRTLTDNRYEEAGLEIVSQQGLYTFCDGVVVRRRFEMEQDPADSAQACPECWIDYQVISTPQGVEVSPRQKAFSNKCQELFWLRMTTRDGLANGPQLRSK